MSTRTVGGSAAIKRKEILTFVTTSMNLEGIMFKGNNSDRERQVLYDVTEMWGL